MDLHFLVPSRWSLFLALLRFLVRLVLTAAITELLELQAASGRLFVLGGRVIPLFALGALQCNNFPHVLNPSSYQPSAVSSQRFSCQPSCCRADS